jgi:hypothetical protein
MSKSGSTLGEEERQLPARLEIGKAESQDDGVGIQLDRFRVQIQTFNRGAESSREILTPIAVEHRYRQAFLGALILH